MVVRLRRILHGDVAERHGLLRRGGEEGIERSGRGRGGECYVDAETSETGVGGGAPDARGVVSRVSMSFSRIRRSTSTAWSRRQSRRARRASNWNSGWTGRPPPRSPSRRSTCGTSEEDGPPGRRHLRHGGPRRCALRSRRWSLCVSHPARGEVAARVGVAVRGRPTERRALRRHDGLEEAFLHGFQRSKTSSMRSRRWRFAARGSSSARRRVERKIRITTR